MCTGNLVLPLPCLPNTCFEAGCEVGYLLCVVDADFDRHDGCRRTFEWPAAIHMCFAPDGQGLCFALLISRPYCLGSDFFDLIATLGQHWLQDDARKCCIKKSDGTGEMNGHTGVLTCIQGKIDVSHGTMCGRGIGCWSKRQQHRGCHPQTVLISHAFKGARSSSLLQEQADNQQCTRHSEVNLSRTV